MARAVAKGPVPSASIRAWYQKGLLDLLEEMRNSVQYWLRAAYRRREDEIVSDASPSRDLEKKIRKLLLQWTDRYDEFAETHADLLAQKANTATTRQLFQALKDAGLTVTFRNSRRVNNVVQSLIAENVGLITSIPRDLLGNVRSIVMIGVQNGRDMSFIADAIEAEFDKGRNHAVRIAVDQVNKATEAIARARCEDLGITHGFWMHRSGSKKPRETHKAFDGERFLLSEGLYDEDVDRNVKPGELIWCRCTFNLDLTTIGGGQAQDIALDKAGKRKVALPAASVTWSDAS